MSNQADRGGSRLYGTQVATGWSNLSRGWRKSAEHTIKRGPTEIEVQNFHELYAPRPGRMHDMVNDAAMRK